MRGGETRTEMRKRGLGLWQGDTGSGGDKVLLGRTQRDVSKSNTVLGQPGDAERK